MIEFVDKTIDEEGNVRVKGTALNRKNFMRMQGFNPTTITFSENQIIEVEETDDGTYTLTTTFNDDGSITEKFEGDYTIEKTTTFTDSGSISVVTDFANEV